MELAADQLNKPKDDETGIIDIDSVSSISKVEIYFTCANCKKKLVQVSVSHVVHCDKCGHTMKLSRCKKSVLMSFVIENEDEKPKPTLTAFKESLQDIMSPEQLSDKDLVTQGFLMLSGIDIHYNKRSLLVTKFVNQAS